jgi:hypothetical protein
MQTPEAFAQSDGSDDSGGSGGFQYLDLPFVISTDDEDPGGFEVEARRRDLSEFEVAAPDVAEAARARADAEQARAVERAAAEAERAAAEAESAAAPAPAASGEDAMDEEADGDTDASDAEGEASLPRASTRKKDPWVKKMSDAMGEDLDWLNDDECDMGYW